MNTLAGILCHMHRLGRFEQRSAKVNLLVGPSVLEPQDEAPAAKKRPRSMNTLPGILRHMHRLDGFERRSAQAKGGLVGQDADSQN